MEKGIQVNVPNVKFKFVEGTDNTVIVFSTGDLFYKPVKVHSHPELGYKDTWVKGGKTVPGCGYRFTGLAKKRGDGEIYIHRLVAKMFVDNPDNLPEVNHKNENRLDNRAENLEWVTRKENYNYSYNRHKLEWNTGKGYGRFIPVRAIDKNGTIQGFRSIETAIRQLLGEKLQKGYKIWSMHANIKMVLDKPTRTAYGYTWLTIPKECNNTVS